MRLLLLGLVGIFTCLNIPKINGQDCHCSPEMPQQVSCSDIIVFVASCRISCTWVFTSNCSDRTLSIVLNTKAKEMQEGDWVTIQNGTGGITQCSKTTYAPCDPIVSTTGGKFTITFSPGPHNTTFSGTIYGSKWSEGVLATIAKLTVGVLIAIVVGIIVVIACCIGIPICICCICIKRKRQREEGIVVYRNT